MAEWSSEQTEPPGADRSALVEGDAFDPRERVRPTAEPWRWQVGDPSSAGSARAVFVVGVQGSGASTVLRAIARDPSVEVHRENESKVFHRFRPRDDDVVRGLIAASRKDLVVLPSLCDSHRTAELLHVGMSEGGAARAVWVYRKVDQQVRSAAPKLGDLHKRVLAEIARGEGGDRWQAQRLSGRSLELIRSVRPEQLSPESAAALFWVVRNRIFLEQRLHQRPDVHLVSHERVVAEPAEETAALARFLGLRAAVPPHPHGGDHRAGNADRLDIHPLVREATTEVETQLELASELSYRRTLTLRAP